MKFVLSALVLGLSFNTFAYFSSFTFDLQSDVGEMWVCGATLNEVEDAPFDLFSGGNFMKATVDGEAVTLSPTLDNKNVRIGPRGSQFGSWSKDDKGEITELAFFLGSERFGARYRVRICWEGPDFQTDEVSNGNSFTANYGGFLFAGVVSDDEGYVPASDLRVKAQWRCQKFDDGGLSKFIPSIDNLGKISGTSAETPNFTAGVLELDTAVLTKCIATFRFRERSDEERVSDQSASINVTAGLFRRD